MKPTVSILDKRFKYTPAAKTDVGATFKRVKKEQAKVTTVPQFDLFAYLARGGARRG